MAIDKPAAETATTAPTLQPKTPAGVRTRAIAEQVKQLRYAAEQAWGSRAWNRFTEEERERHLAYQFMALLAAQEETEGSPLNHYRAVARRLFGNEE